MSRSSSKRLLRRRAAAATTPAWQQAFRELLAPRLFKALKVGALRPKQRSQVRAMLRLVYSRAELQEKLTAQRRRR